jgi:hypothetical protein
MASAYKAARMAGKGEFALEFPVQGDVGGIVLHAAGEAAVLVRRQYGLRRDVQIKAELGGCGIAGRRHALDGKAGGIGVNTAGGMIGLESGRQRPVSKCAAIHATTGNWYFPLPVETALQHNFQDTSRWIF